MRILYLAQLVPYPMNAGPKVRIYHVLQYLASAGHAVTLVAFRRPDDTPEALAHVAQLCADVHTVLMPRAKWRDAVSMAKSLVKNTPFLIQRDGVTAMNTLLQQLVSEERFDAIHADQLWMAQYALRARAYTRKQAAYDSDPLLVLDKHNAVYLIPQRLAENGGNVIKQRLLGLEARKMARFELETCAQFDHVVWVTDEDRAALAAVNDGRWQPVGRTIPICVDSAEKAQIDLQPDAHRVTFLGGLHWPPNAQGIVWFADEVWPLVVAEVPHAVLTVIGRNPPAELADTTRRNVEAPGYVEDLTSYLRETAVFTVPLHAGGGMRVKIIDAWSWGLPIVSTGIGAEGIDYSAGENILIADDAAAFAQATIRLLQSSVLRTKIGVAGRKTLEQKYDWRRVYHEWDYYYSQPKSD
jgi:glycosyltransferase involved in cell wall biosynthesis